MFRGIGLALLLGMLPPPAAADGASSPLWWQWEDGPRWWRDGTRPDSDWPGLSGSAAELGIHLSEIEGGNEAAWRNHEGDRASQGLHATLEGGGTARATSWASVRLRPRVVLGGGVARISWLEALLSMRAGPARLEAGRTRMWLGPARHGSLLLSTNARALDQVHLFVGSAPTRRSHLLGPLRSARAGASVAFLSDRDRRFPNPDLGVMYLASGWGSWLEIQLLRTVMFAGEGRGFRASWGGLGDILFADNENPTDDGPNISDQKASIVFLARLDRLLAPWLSDAVGKDGSLCAYYEYAGEDNVHGFLVRNPANSGGVLYRRDGWELQAEIAVNRRNAALWYTHAVYASGYTYRGDLLGHHMGGDSSDASLSLVAPLSERRRARFFGERKATLYSERDQPATEWTLAGSLERIASFGQLAVAVDLLFRWGNEYPTERLGPMERNRVSTRLSWSP